MRASTLVPYLLMFPVGEGFQSQDQGGIRSRSFGRSPRHRGGGAKPHDVVSLSMHSSQQQRQGVLRTMFRSSPSSTGAAVGILFGASLILSTPASIAAAAAADDNYYGSSSSPSSVYPSVLSGEYSDPQYPQCQRTLQVDEDGITLHFSGTNLGSTNDHPAGGVFLRRGSSCSSRNEIQKYGLRTERFDGQILPSGGLKLNLGHEGVDDEGVWEPANSVIDPKLSFKAVDGIRWKDGTKWIVKKEQGDKPLSTVIGEWIFLAYIGFSTLAGVKGVWDKIQQKRNRTG